MSRCFSLLCTAALLAGFSGVPLSAAARIQPLDGAPYSASATLPPSVVKVFTGTYTGEGPDRQTQASQAFARMEDDLIAAGLSMRDVVNVRGYLKVMTAAEAETALAMEQWNAAFEAAFADNVHPPTRTTLGVAELEGQDAQVAVEAVVAIAADSWDPSMASLGNPRWQRTLDGHAPLAIVAPYTPLVMTSGVLADPLSEGGSDFGDMGEQTRSVLGKLETALRHWGLGPQDVVYVRALLSPRKARYGNRLMPTDFSGYRDAAAAFWGAHGLDEPPTAVLSAPGFSAINRHVEIEFYAAFPDAARALFRPASDTDLRRDRREGAEDAFLSRSVAIARDASLVWLSGAVDSSRPGHEGQGMETLLNLQERLATLELGMEDVVALRAYFQIENSFGADFQAWNQAYKRFFDHPKLNAEKPARTAFPVTAIPGAGVLEVEVIAVD